jgi:hypothetical protein
VVTQTRLNVTPSTSIHCLSFCNITSTLTTLHIGAVIMYWPCVFSHLQSTKLCTNVVYIGAPCRWIRIIAEKWLPVSGRVKPVDSKFSMSVLTNRSNFFLVDFVYHVTDAKTPNFYISEADSALSSGKKHLLCWTPFSVTGYLPLQHSRV